MKTREAMFEKELVKAVGFDLDECIYPSDPEINNLIRNYISSALLKKLSFADLAEARAFFEKKYAELHSGSKVLVSVGYNINEANNITDGAAAQDGIIKLIKKDPNTSRIIRAISNQYEWTFLITSSPRNVADSKLMKIGINPLCFTYMIYGDDPGYGHKIDGTAFRQIISKTGLAPDEHVYIGNSRKADIEPAKNAGMRTIGVWSEIPEADLSIKHIHDLERVLL